jgi:hypothetical protein
LSILLPPILIVIHPFFSFGGEPIKPDQIGSINVSFDATRVVFDDREIIGCEFPKNA